jgi:hypothetical protein
VTDSDSDERQLPDTSAERCEFEPFDDGGNADDDAAVDTFIANLKKSCPSARLQQERDVASSSQLEARPEASADPRGRPPTVGCADCRRARARVKFECKVHGLTVSHPRATNRDSQGTVPSTAKKTKGGE